MAISKIFGTFNDEIINDIRSNLKLHSLCELVSKKTFKFCQLFTQKGFSLIFGSLLVQLNSNS